MENNARTATVMHSFSGKQAFVSPAKVLVTLLIITVLGVGSGYILSQLFGSTGGSLPGISNMKGQTFGSDDLETFKDTAEGTLVTGGIDDEGEYHLVRPGGESQNVYLISSLVDLSQFVGKEIKVWGETQTAQKAGWLMDVGRVEVLK